MIACPRVVTRNKVVRDSSSSLRLRPLTSNASLISSPSPERVREDARGERLELRRARAFLHVGHVRLDARAVRAHLQGWSSGSGRVSLCVGRNVTSRVVASSSGRESARGTDLRFTPRRAGRQSRGDGGGLLRRRRARAAHPAHPPTRVRESDGSWETTDENTFRRRKKANWLVSFLSKRRSRVVHWYQKGTT